MIARLEQAAQQWGGQNEQIDLWLKNRQELLVDYCKLVGLPPYEREHHALPEKVSVKLFCERLVDYISAGHFEVYDTILEESEPTPECRALADTVFPQITDSTDAALAFNDRFAEWQDDEELDDLDVSLSQLGQALERRFELEDSLIHNLHQNHL